MPENDPYNLAPPSPPSPPLAELLPGRPIETDRRCPKCAYNLRGLPSKKHRCPECGSPIVDRFVNDQLQYGNPLWITQVALGILVFFVGALCFPVQLGILLGAELPPWVGILLGAAGSALECLGLWRLSTAEPVPQIPERRWSFRRLLRWAALATCTLDALARGCFLVHWGLAEYLLLPLAALLVLRAFLIGFYLHSLAQRIPDDSLANRTVNITWGLVISSPTLFFGIVTATIFLHRGAVHMRDLYCVSLPALPFLVFYIWSLWLLALYVKNLRASAREARKTMLAQPPGSA